MALGLSALAVGLLIRSTLGQPAPGRAPPFAITHPAVATDKTEVVLYVSEECPWCALELDGWAAAMESGASRGPLIAYAPGSSAEAAARLPGSLRERWILDGDGTLAKDLGVAAVPLLARIDIGGNVAAVTVGLTSPATRRSLLAHLDTPPLHDGAHP